MLECCQKERKAIIKTIPDDKLKDAAKNFGTTNPKKWTSSTTTYNRDELVSEFTKRRTNGKCDLCGNDAPFSKNGIPYLECHHVIHLADHGPDAIYITVELCPNCHRKIHILNKKSDLNILKSKIKFYLEIDSDTESFRKFNELFGE